MDAGNPVLPKKFLIKNVPFAVQSPDSKWDEREKRLVKSIRIIVDHFWKQTPLGSCDHAQGEKRP